jgi:uncharacterized iron-regulated membrane protein
MDTRHWVSLLVAFILTVIVLSGSSYAIPAFFGRSQVGDRAFCP